MTTIAAKELLICVQRDQRAVMVLVPKQRGEGFLKVPLGHHVNAVSKLCEEIGYDTFGLEGHLHFETGYINHGEQWNKAVAHIGDALAAHYGLPWREVREPEFWDNHPIPIN
jgi:hypothetical protein